MNLPDGSRVGKLRLTISAASERAAVCWSIRVPVVPPRSRAERKSLASILNCSESSRAMPSARSCALCTKKSSRTLERHVLPYYTVRPVVVRATSGSKEVGYKA